MLMSREFGDSSRGATDGRRGSHPQIHEVHRSPERSAPLIRGAQRRRTVGPRGVVDGGTHYVHDSQSRQEARVRRSRQSVRLVDRALPLKNLGARPIEYRDRAQLARFNILGERRNGRIGIWVADRSAGSEAKIGAIGVRVTRWVSWHGIALNVAPDLSHFAGIVPCGISEHGVTSLHALGIPATMPEADAALRAAWDEVFGI